MTRGQKQEERSLLRIKIFRHLPRVPSYTLSQYVKLVNTIERGLNNARRD